MVGSYRTRGLREWLVQRITAILLLAYFAVLFTLLFQHGHGDYAYWHTLFLNKWMKLATFAALLAIMWHAWIGLWTIFTDYIKCKAIRLTMQVFVCLLMAGYLIWGYCALWA